mmetsp:Transcript_17558/g.25806  ORF Transcript_17558/g.25806 Transcript_17558/m.25806 type:complete len:95 (-) Transcript_17558:36-320(-)
MVRKTALGCCLAQQHTLNIYVPSLVIIFRTTQHNIQLQEYIAFIRRVWSEKGSCLSMVLGALWIKRKEIISNVAAGPSKFVLCIEENFTWRFHI